MYSKLCFIVVFVGLFGAPLWGGLIAFEKWKDILYKKEVSSSECAIIINDYVKNKYIDIDDILEVYNGDKGIFFVTNIYDNLLEKLINFKGGLIDDFKDYNFIMKEAQSYFSEGFLGNSFTNEDDMALNSLILKYEKQLPLSIRKSKNIFLLFQPESYGSATVQHRPFAVIELEDSNKFIFIIQKGS